MMNRDEYDFDYIQEPISQACPEVKQILQRVLELEKNKLYHKNTRYINDDVLKIIKEIINETYFNQAD